MTLIEILEAREEALDVHEVADLLKVSERHIYELAADGSLPAFRIGKVIRFDPQDVADWLRRRKPADKQHSQPKPEQHRRPKPKRSQEGSISPTHVWRNKARLLEMALTTNSSADVESGKNS